MILFPSHITRFPKQPTSQHRYKKSTSEVKDTTVSVQEQRAPTAVMFTYPNPANDYVCFQYPGPDEGKPSLLKIYSSLGNEIKNPKIYNSGTKMVWDTRDINPGEYFYTFNPGEDFSSGKIIVE